MCDCVGDFVMVQQRVQHLGDQLSRDLGEDKKRQQQPLHHSPYSSYS